MFDDIEINNLNVDSTNDANTEQEVQSTNPVDIPQQVEQPIVSSEPVKPGPNEALAEYRRRTEIAEQISKNPEVLNFIKAQEAKKLQERAAQNKIAPEVQKEIDAIKNKQETFEYDKQISNAAQNLNSHAQKAGMTEQVKTEYLQWAEKTQSQGIQNLMLQDGFDHSLFIKAFANSKGVTETKNSNQINAPTFIPGHGSVNSGNPVRSTDEYKKHIIDTVKKG